MRTKFWQNYFLGKGFAKTSADLFLNLDVANGKGGVWGGIFHLLLFLFWGNSGRTKMGKIENDGDFYFSFFLITDNQIKIWNNLSEASRLKNFPLSRPCAKSFRKFIPNFSVSTNLK